MQYVAIWPRYWSQLQDYQRADVHIRGIPKTLSSKAIHIKAGSVQIRQCVDGTTVRVLQHGKPAPGGVKTPYLVRIDLGQAADSNKWLIYNIVDTSTDKRPARCGA